MPNEELDNTVLKEEFKSQLVAMYNSRNVNNGGIQPNNVGSNFTLTTAEKRQLAQTALSLLRSYGLTDAEINADLARGNISTMTRSAVRKLLTKVAVKYLGVIGAIYAVYEFGDCMEWW